jgi:hypothetical protein
VWENAYACVRVCLGGRALACACARVALLIQRATRHHIVICSLSASILIKLEFSRQFLEKSSNIKFLKIHPVVAELYHADRHTAGRTDGLTDGYDEANSHFSQFCKRANH